jgi:cell division protein ZapA
MDPIAVTVQILGKDYRVACPSHERESLMASARYLNDKMRELKGSGKIVGSERVAVMAALNIAHELLQEHAEKQRQQKAIESRLQGLQQRISMALDSNSQLQM